MSTISLKVEFGGGLELLFDNQKSHKLSLPARVPLDNSTSPPPPPAPSSPSSPQQKEYEGSTKPVDVTFLIHWLRDHLLKERAELFMEGDTVRPGILVLINDTDWELEGEGEYVIKNGDEIVFISTLHGG